MSYHHDKSLQASVNLRFSKFQTSANLLPHHISFHSSLSNTYSVVNVTTVLADPFPLPILGSQSSLLFLNLSLGFSVSKHIQAGCGRGQGRHSTWADGGKGAGSGGKADDGQDERNEEGLHGSYCCV